MAGMAQSLYAQLILADVEVLAARALPGSLSDCAGIDVKVTGTGQTTPAAKDLERVRRQAVAMVDRKARVWLLRNGPVRPGPAQVYVAASSKDYVSEQQQKVVDVVTAIIAPDAEPVEDQEPDDDQEVSEP